jgi:hypothetical protein
MLNRGEGGEVVIFTHKIFMLSLNFLIKLSSGVAELWHRMKRSHRKTFKRCLAKVLLLVIILNRCLKLHARCHTR